MAATCYRLGMHCVAEQSEIPFGVLKSIPFAITTVTIIYGTCRYFALISITHAAVTPHLHTYVWYGTAINTE
jgi:hypothetical protein